MAQTDYDDMSTGQPGDLGYGAGGADHLVCTYNVVTADLIKPGLGVCKISGDENGVKLPDASNVQMLGVATRDTSEENTEDASFTYAAKAALGVVRRGAVWVTVEQDVTPDDAVYVRFDGEVEVFTITWDGDFVASNKINGSINGVAIAEVTFDTDQATTIALVAAAIEALATVDTAAVTDTREITVTGATEGLDISTNATFTVTLGASQAADTVANVTGPSAGTQSGAFRKDDDSTGNVGATALAMANCKFLTNGTAGGKALLDLNIA